jgi:hypothetical protein
VKEVSKDILETDTLSQIEKFRGSRVVSIMMRRAYIVPPTDISDDSSGTYIIFSIHVLVHSIIDY